MRHYNQICAILGYGLFIQPHRLTSFAFWSQTAMKQKTRCDVTFPSRSELPHARETWFEQSRISNRKMSSNDSSSQTDADFSDAEQELIDSLYEKCQAAVDEETKEKIMLETLPTLRPSLLMKLRDAESYTNNSAISSMSQQLNKMLRARLDLAKSTLQELLSAGEIRKLDNLIGSAARSGRLDVAFFNVLTVNLQEAMESNNKNTDDDSDDDSETDDAAASRLQILKHVYTRCQEEVEKTIPPGTALLNKLLRTEQPSIRSNLYEHYLTPRPNTITTPDGSIVTLNGTQPVLVSIQEFVEAIDTAVLQIRDVENSGGTDKESAAMMVEGCRHIAKEARVVVGNAYGRESDELMSLEEGLQPVFRPSNATSPYIAGRV